MSVLIDMTGHRFGRWTVVHRASKPRHWSCRCDCGSLKEVFSTNLTGGKSQSCGCLHNELVGNTSRIHGLSQHPLAGLWSNIKQRCTNPNREDFYLYGGRGIVVCDEWSNSFKSFYDWALSNGYRKGLSIDRKDVDGKYEPDNCQWVTQKEQANNRRNNRLVTLNGVTKTLQQWSDELGMNHKTLSNQLSRGEDVLASVGDTN